MLTATEEYYPTRVIQIVSGSRSGSTLLKKLLALSPDVDSLDGEEEPYFKLCGAGYGLTSSSDEFHSLPNPVLFRRCIATELTTIQHWPWRLSLQYTGKKLAKLLEALAWLPYNSDKWEFLRNQGIAGHYDGCEVAERLPFKEMVYEMPPYIVPTSRYRAPTKVLLLKSPYNAYRKGLLEQIFPRAQFSYVVLTRNPGATINGLIDGWKCNYGFHKHLTPYGWWKFDLPPNWPIYTRCTVAERSWFQWKSSYEHILAGWRGHSSSIEVQFEDLLGDPEGFMKRLFTRLRIDPPREPIRELPRTMATDVPTPGRFKAKMDVIGPLLERSEGLIKDLGYSDRSTWI